MDRAARSSRAHAIHAKVDEVGREQPRAPLHRSPRTFGTPTDVWTLGLVAEGITAETIRQAMGRLGVRWKRARPWITSPDREDARENVRATA